MSGLGFGDFPMDLMVKTLGLGLGTRSMLLAGWRCGQGVLLGRPWFFLPGDYNGDPEEFHMDRRETLLGIGFDIWSVYVVGSVAFRYYFASILTPMCGRPNPCRLPYFLLRY